jgi:hypothetical protein
VQPSLLFLLGGLPVGHLFESRELSSIQPSELFLLGGFPVGEIFVS